jgi:hypothetical protein
LKFVNKFVLDISADAEKTINKFIFLYAVINFGNIDLTNVKTYLNVWAKAMFWGNY